MTNEFEIDVPACRGRQERLLHFMHHHDLQLVIVTRIEHVQWLTGARFAWTFSPVAALRSDGHVVLVCPERREPDAAAADEIIAYPAQLHSTLRNDQPLASSEVLLQSIGERIRAKRIGVEYSCCGPHLTRHVAGQLMDVEPELYRLRRQKDADELALIRMAISGTECMYRRAREIIQPGISELEVFNQLQSAAVEQFGEMMTGTGNDYQCCSRGGPPRNRLARAGELYILDLGPAFRGYFADNARTIAVTDADEDQAEAWRHIMRVFDHVEATVRPGKSAKELFREAEAMLSEAPFGQFNHHLGHGIGLFPHEAPHLNPHWDDTFQAGEVFTVEPGLYDAEKLRAGMRIENDYLVTDDGVELLTAFPIEL